MTEERSDHRRTPDHITYLTGSFMYEISINYAQVHNNFLSISPPVSYLRNRKNNEYTNIIMTFDVLF